jgi:hypothetical protein
MKMKSNHQQVKQEGYIFNRTGEKVIFNWFKQTLSRPPWLYFSFFRTTIWTPNRTKKPYWDQGRHNLRGFSIVTSLDFYANVRQKPEYISAEVFKMCDTVQKTVQKEEK